MASNAFNLSNVALTSSSSSNATIVTFTGNLLAQSLEVQGSYVPPNGIYLPAANTIGFTTGSSERVRVTSAGNVQIGTTTQTTNRTAGLVINNINGGGTEWVNNNNGGGNVSALSTGGLAFSTFTGAVGAEVITERMRIDSGGNMGLGTSSPVGAGLTLNLQGSATSEYSSIVSGSPLNANFISLYSGQTVDPNPSLVFNNSLRFGTATSPTTAGYVERFRLGSSGQIGIAGANYGTSGQVLTSGGASAAPSWASTAFASAVLTDKTSTRANATTYQNTTTGWLFVSVRDSNNGQSFSVGPSSASLAIFNTNIAPGTAIGLVPPSYYYSISGSILQSWYEGQA